MTGQRGLFDAALSDAERIRGMEDAAVSRAATLGVARGVALGLAMHGEEITADDVVKVMVDQGFDVHALGNAAGSLFRGDGWQWTGRYKNSTRVHAHSNPLRVWRRKP